MDLESKNLTEQEEFLIEDLLFAMQVRAIFVVYFVNLDFIKTIIVFVLYLGDRRQFY